MPFVSLQTSAGAVEMCYVIATPTSDSTDTIIPGFPCILLIHAETSGKVIFEAQFCDPHLRSRYNMIALDLRAHGDTVGPVQKGVYTLCLAAEDIYHFMTALNLPPVHLFGVSIGTYLSLLVATEHPELVLSATLCSHPPECEPEESLEGRLQIVDFLAASFKMDGQPLSSANVNPAYLSELVQGGLQFLFSGTENQLTEPLMTKLILYGIQNWGASPEHLAQASVVATDWIVDQKAFNAASLSKIRCPISIIHSTDDVAYGSDIQSLEDFAVRLREAGNNDVTIHTITGSHLAVVTHPQDVNEIILKQITAVTQGTSYFAVEDFPYEDDDSSPLQTPFTEQLAQYGYNIADPDLAFERSYPKTEDGIKLLVEDHFPNCPRT